MGGLLARFKERGEGSGVCDLTTMLLALPFLAYHLYKGSSVFRQIKKSSIFCIKGARCAESMRQLLKLFSSDALSPVASHFPMILEKPLKPYVCAEWGTDRRFQELHNHFTALALLFDNQAEKLYRPEGLELYTFDSMQNKRYSVQLFPGYLNEGSLGIRLCDDQQREIYTLSFHLSQLSEGICYIGALQGPNDRIPERQAIIVSVTRSLFGLRPKALLLETLYPLCALLGYRVLLGVANQSHIYQARQLAKKKGHVVLFDGDALWREYHAKPYCEHFMQLPEWPQRRAISMIKSSKRSLYKRRYEWLDGMKIQVQSSLEPLLIEPRAHFSNPTDYDFYSDAA